MVHNDLDLGSLLGEQVGGSAEDENDGDCGVRYTDSIWSGCYFFFAGLLSTSQQQITWCRPAVLVGCLGCGRVGFRVVYRASEGWNSEHGEGKGTLPTYLPTCLSKGAEVTAAAVAVAAMEVAYEHARNFWQVRQYFFFISNTPCIVDTTLSWISGFPSLDSSKRYRPPRLYTLSTLIPPHMTHAIVRVETVGLTNGIYKRVSNVHITIHVRVYVL